MTDPLRDSTLDDIELGKAVQQRFLTLCDRHQKATGLQLAIPEGMRPDFVRWRKMVLRHRRGDLRHRLSELKSTKAVAEWTVAVNDRLCGQVPQRVAWKD